MYMNNHMHSAPQSKKVENRCILVPYCLPPLIPWWTLKLICSSLAK